MNLKIQTYGDQQYVAVENLKIPKYYRKKEIEGENKTLFEAIIQEHGIKAPIVINAYPGREGCIIDGVARFRLSERFGIYEIPFIALYLTETEEEQFHLEFSMKNSEYSITELVTYLKRHYTQYFEISIASATSDDIFQKVVDVMEESGDKMLQRKHTFPLRLHENYKDYPERLQRLIGAKSRNEAIVQLIVDAVEGRLGL